MNNKNYGDLPFEKLREMIIGGEIEHSHMSEEDYSFVLDNETELDNPAAAVLDFCTDGLKRFGKYNKYRDIHIDLDALFGTAERGISSDNPPSGIETVQAREPSQPSEPSVKPRKRRAIMTCAIACSWIVIIAVVSYFGLMKNPPTPSVVPVPVSSREPEDVAPNPTNPPITPASSREPDGTAPNPPQFEISPDDTANQVAAQSIPEVVTAVSEDGGGDDPALPDGVRRYGSVGEMLQNEHISVMFPERLPADYAFTHFEVTDSVNGLEVCAYADEPYINFTVRIGAQDQLGFAVPETSFGGDSDVVGEQTGGTYNDSEINGIRYRISEIGGGLYEAYWINGADSYTILVKDLGVIEGIIGGVRVVGGG